MMRAAMLVVAVATAAPGVAADEAAPAPRPWDHASEADKAAATDEFKRANQAFAEEDYATAIAHYDAALARWDHPAIHGNLAVALIQVDRVLAAYEHLEQAVRHGAEPFEPTVWSQLTTARKLLQGQVGRVALTGDRSGVDTLLDGVPLGPAAEHLVRAGSHELVARRPGFLTFTQRLDVPAGRVTTVRIALVPLEDATESERRWPVWRPWAVVGAGAAVAAIGVGFELAARDNVLAYEREVGRACPSGCTVDALPQAVRDLADRASWQDAVGVTAIGVGIATVAVGGLLVAWNQPRRIRVDESGRRLSRSSPRTTDLAWRVSIAPVIRADGATVFGRFQF